jgi:hypothetical protein
MKKSALGLGVIGTAIGTGYLVSKMKEHRKSPLEKFLDRF